MGITVAEYLGIDVVNSLVDITPIVCCKVQGREMKPNVQCPFKSGHCMKAAKGDKPVCSVRDSDNNLWIVCEHRLCATSPKQSLFNNYQTQVLHAIAKKVYDDEIPFSDVLVKREERIPVTGGSSYSADYVMWRLNPRTQSPTNLDRAVILEMQGGGETSNTGSISRMITNWEMNSNPTNDLILQHQSKASPIPSNAWRRQQEQFLVKGNVAMLTGAKMVFCVGSLIFNYLLERFRDGILTDLSRSNWTLAIIAIEEKDGSDPNGIKAGNSIPIGIDETNIIYTNYGSFVQALTNQSEPAPQVFCGEYNTLLNGVHYING